MFTFGESTYTADEALSQIDTLLKQTAIINSIELSKYIYEFYKFLSKYNFVKENKMQCPIDSYAYIGDFGEYKAIYLDNYNCTHYHFVIVLINDLTSFERKYICIQYYDDLNEDDMKYYKDYKDMLQSVDILLSYSDCVEENNYISRPNLEYIKNNINEIIEGKKYYGFSPILQYPMTDKLMNRNISTKSIGWFYSILKSIDQEISDNYRSEEF